ncbi:transmembrane protein [Cystoisospora suis]|uniref:Transmembrane protein n=1 Tax=Cystoisospora suis TaxID=483139 RepID=A0A2C6LG23_9APIC|nr:transmembrane protein [Cystoisospora suis]
MDSKTQPEISTEEVPTPAEQIPQPEEAEVETTITPAHSITPSPDEREVRVATTRRPFRHHYRDAVLKLVFCISLAVLVGVIGSGIVLLFDLPQKLFKTDHRRGRSHFAVPISNAAARPEPLSFLHPSFSEEEAIPAVAVIFKPDPRTFAAEGSYRVPRSSNPEGRTNPATPMNSPTIAPRVDGGDTRRLVGNIRSQSQQQGS